jgi:tetratricopeptide (TPR) repeat protein
MRLTFMSGAVAVLSLVSAPTALTAQPGGVSSACTIDQNNPKELAMQMLNLQKARTATAPEARRAALSAIAKELDTKPERFAKNPAGYNLALTQMLVMWGVEPGVGLGPVTRGQLGFVTNPEQPYDIVSSLDAAYKAMITAVPSCADEVKASRQNEYWLALTRAALDASNAGKHDSAEYFAKRSMLMSTDNPYPHYVLANVANAKNDKKGAISHWQEVVRIAGTDTTYRDLRNSSMYYASMSGLEIASTQSGAEQAATAKEAAAGFKTLLAENPEHPDAANLLSGWADALTLAKDTASIPTVYAGLLAAPDKSTDIVLTMGGVIATRVNKTDDALKLFEAAVAKNSTGRDALRNLAATYYGKEQYQKMFSPSAKLVALDPNNYDGWMMFAYAAQGLAKASKVPAEKKAWTDTLVKYQTYAENLPAKVDIGGFTRGANNASLTLSVEQIAAAGNYTITAEFLDLAGNVVATATQATGDLKKGDTKSYTLKADGKGIYGYRYKPLK